MKYNINQTWYSEELVNEVQVPKLSNVRSRYDLKERLLLEDGNLVIRNMRKNDLVPNTSSNDMLHIVKPGERHRPDIIANNVYGDPRLAWIILSANNLSDIFDLETDLEIVIPSSSSIYSAGGVLRQ